MSIKPFWGNRGWLPPTGTRTAGLSPDNTFYICLYDGVIPPIISLRNSNRRIHRAWVLKDEFEHFWNYRYRASAKKFLRRWMTAALRSRIPTMRTFVGTLRTHLVHIMAFIDRPLTNAVGEGLNRLIKIVKNRASGYRHLDHFADMIYLTVRDLDIPAQIPSQLRTL